MAGLVDGSKNREGSSSRDVNDIPRWPRASSFDRRDARSRGSRRPSSRSAPNLKTTRSLTHVTDDRARLPTRSQVRRERRVHADPSTTRILVNRARPAMRSALREARESVKVNRFPRVVAAG